MVVHSQSIRKVDEMKIPSDDKSTTLHALFPTLVYQTALEQRDTFRAAFEQVLPEQTFNPKVRGNAKYNAGEYHGMILLHQSQTLQPFFQTLAHHVSQYLKTMGMRSELFEMQCLKSWFVFCDSDAEDDDDAIVPHNHSCSDISWVYYVDVPEDAGAVKFHGGSPPATAIFESAFHYDWHNDEKSAINSVNWWNSESWSVHPTNGDLLLFPGHQVHSVDANRSKLRRITVAGDIALTLKKQHRNLEFGRTSPQHWLTLDLGGTS